MSKTTLTLTFSILLGIALPVAAFQTRLLGTARLAFSEDDKEVINISACPKPAYTHIQLRVKGGDADIKKLVVKYRNSEKESLSVAEKIRQGKSSRWIDLKGERRCLEKIKVIGDTDDSSNRKALIEFWGRY
jgi:hypothetical protein